MKLSLLLFIAASSWSEAAVWPSVGILGSHNPTGKLATSFLSIETWGVPDDSSLVADKHNETEDWRPPRIFRTGSKGRHASDEKAKYVGDGQCGVTYTADSGSDKFARCPPECPFYAQDRTDDRHCTFVCINGNDCSKWNPNKPIADEKLNICRSPMVNACSEYNLDGTDRCLVCNSGYRLGEDGLCYYKYIIVVYIVAGLFATMMTIAMVLFFDMMFRPITNPTGVREGWEFNQRQVLYVKGDEEKTEDGRWPLTTNLCRVDVAGAGMILHFNFQAVCILWLLMVAGGWATMATLVDPALWVLGTRKFGTPRMNCILVAWGYETQQRLMWTKVLFCWCVYIGSFVLALLHGIRQLRLFKNIDKEMKTMKDFAVMIVGLPALSGSRKLEDELKKEIETFTAQTVIGVSIAWNFKEQEENIMAMAQKNNDELEEAYKKKNNVVDEQVEEQPERTGFRAKMYDFELSVLGPADDLELPDVKQTLSEIVSTDNAFVVFDTEKARDEAKAKVNEAGLDFEGAKIYFEDLDCEPTTVFWQNFGHSGTKEKIWRLARGFLFILLGLCGWVAFFYAPYAYSIFNFNYDNGQEPPFIYSMTFSMVVVVGNNIMYEICNRVAENVGFRFKDEKEACYLVMYLIACTFNILMDMYTTYCMAWEIMKGLGFRTYFGQRLEDVTFWPEGFETYAIQRALAENTFTYLFPSTCLIPFILEPMPTIVMPLLAGKIIVRTHKEIRGRDAEGWMMALPMEMGRYSDLLLNLMLAILILFFPGGYTASLFFLTACSHVFIYVFDHWRVIRIIPNCTFASMNVDWWSQACFAPLVAMVLTVLVFKANNEPGYHAVTPLTCVAYCVAAFVFHNVVHLLLLVYFVPKFGSADDEEDKLAGVTYKEIAVKEPANWFTTNPVHCLRSKNIYSQSPPCTYFEFGKEYLIQENPKIGNHFKPAVPAKEV